jgi:Ca-activated chloride channel family protein
MTSPLTFAHPHLFWTLLALPVLAAVFIMAERARRAALNRLLAARLQPKLAGSVSTGRRRAGFVLLLAGLALCLAALTGPRWGVTFEETASRGRDVIIAVDTSRSMLAQDLSPNRLDRARFAALDLLGELAGDRVGVVAFAGEAFLQAPLTPDHDAIGETLRALDTEAIGQGGSNLAAAIETAREAFGKGESTHRALVLFSDGEELQDDALAMADKYKDQFRIFTVGVGTEAGAPVVRPLRRGSEYVRDEAGNLVTTKLEETRLREVAKLSGGFYLRLQNGPADMRQLAASGLATMSEKEIDTRTKEVPRERFQWPLIAGLVCLAASLLLGERRRFTRTATAALFLFLVSAPADAQNSSGNAIDRTLGEAQESDSPDAPAQPEGPPEVLRKLEAERERRPGVPELDYNLGCAAFAAGDFDKATSAFSRAFGAGDPELKAKAAYNLGNALARRGAKVEKEAKLADWTNAITQYNHVLALQPSHEQAKVNRDIVRKAIDDLKKKEEEEKKKQEQEKKQQQSKQDQSKDEKQQGEQNQGDKQQDQKSDKGEQSKDNQPGEQQKPGEEKSQQPKPQQGDGKDGQPEQPAEQAAPKPGEQPPQNPRDGNLQPAGQPQDPGKDKDAAEAAEAAQAAREGRMTEKDARALLQGMRKFDQTLRPLEQYERQSERRQPKGGKDW